jgi:cell division inhibitor SepF
MASMWRRAMHYLGLGPDEDYEDYDLLDPYSDHASDVDDPARRSGPVAPAPGDPRPALRTLPPSPSGAVEPPGAASNGHTSRLDPPADRLGAAERTGRATGPRSAPPPATRSAAVRPLAVPPSAKPYVVAPAAFADAQEVADQFKSSVPVIVNLQGVERDLMRRIIDFASGLCYALNGQMERVANHVYLLTPSDVEVSAEERRRLRDRGYEA